MSDEEFTTRPASEGPHVLFSLVAQTVWKPHDAGMGQMRFYKRKRGAEAVTCYAIIPDVPPGHEGRAITVWILAHPWRMPTAARMVHAFVELQLRKHRS